MLPEASHPAGSIPDGQRLATDLPGEHEAPGYGKDRPGAPSGSFFGVYSYSRANMATASRSRSMYGSPLTSTATRLIVPPVKRCGDPFG